MRPWNLFCEVAAEETWVLTTADEKPGEGVTKKKDHINLKVAGQGSSVVQLNLRGIHHLVN